MKNKCGVFLLFPGMFVCLYGQAEISIGAGYKGGGVEIQFIAAAGNVKPNEDDDFAAIQAAVNTARFISTRV
jgi:hypothetical protein